LAEGAKKALGGQVVCVIGRARLARANRAAAELRSAAGRAAAGCHCHGGTVDGALMEWGALEGRGRVGGALERQKGGAGGALLVCVRLFWPQKKGGAFFGRSARVARHARHRPADGWAARGAHGPLELAAPSSPTTLSTWLELGEWRARGT